MAVQLFGDMERRSETFTCEETGKRFSAEQIKVAGEWTPRFQYCPEVEERREAEDKERRREEAREARAAHMLFSWRTLCPPDMRETDLTRLDRPERVTGWRREPKGKGLVIHGETGYGKTRLLWALLKALSEAGTVWDFWRANRLADAVTKDFGKQKEEIVAEACRAPVLALDDLGKERTTPEWEAALFDLIDWRAERGRPVLVTTNFVGERLVARYKDKEMAAALVRRLKEFNESVYLREVKPCP